MYVIPELRFHNVNFKGGSGGGGGSGRVDYPEYMKTQHEAWLTLVAADMVVAFANDPYSAAIAYDPDDDLANADVAICGFNTLIDALSYDSDWIAAISDAVATIDGTVISNSSITDAVDAYEQVQGDILNYKTLPEFESGMRDINAVQSSTFVVGKAVLLGMFGRDVGKFNADLRHKAYIQRNELVIKGVDQMLRSLMHRVDSEGKYAVMKTEFNRLKIIAKAEEETTNTAYDENSAKWDLEIYQYGANMLAAIGGGVASGASQKKPSTLQSALGGAASGAAMGAMFGPYGMAAGAALGAGAALLS